MVVATVERCGVDVVKGVQKSPQRALHPDDTIRHLLNKRSIIPSDLGNVRMEHNVRVKC